MIATSAGGVALVLVFRDAGDRLQSLPEKLQGIVTEPTVMYARDARTKLYQVTNERREPISSYSDVPAFVRNATLAAEDKRFFEHSGVDYRAIMRSMFTNAKEGRSAQGASTITMQLAKRLFTSPEKSLTRKLSDVALAVLLERKLMKEQILLLYLNQVYYGQGAYGIKAAADVYFGVKDLNKLSAGQAAMLARLVRRPSDENPYVAPKTAILNRNNVLWTMRTEGWLTEEQFEKAESEDTLSKLKDRHFGSGEQIYAAPYYVRYILDRIHKEMPDLDIEQGGYQIVTTLDPDLQKVSEKEVRDLVRRHRSSRVTTAAFVLMGSDGQILSMVGGVDFDRNQYNVVYQGRRQPGSSFKPIVYSTALSTGALRPGDSISNERFTYTDPITHKTWAPKNSGGGYGGYYSIKSAIANSKNIPAVRVCEMAGPGIVSTYARDVFGFKSEIRPNLSLGLGTSEVSPLEMAQAYSIFLLHGDRATPFGITSIIGPDHSVVKSFEPQIRHAMLDPSVAGLMDEYLRAVITEGTGHLARVVVDARGKTGTTQDNRDAWFCGYTNNAVGIGWIADEILEKGKPPRYEPMPHVFGGTVTVELWRNVMLAAQKKLGVGERRKGSRLERDIDVVSDSQPKEKVPVDDVNPGNDEVPDSPKSSGAQKNGNDQGDPPIPDTVPPITDAHPPKDPPVRHDPPVESGEYVSVEVCADTGKRATIYCPETIVRRFRKGSEPKTSCRKHGP